MKKIQILGAAVVLWCGAAAAGTIQVGGTAVGAAGRVSAQPGVCTVDFNSFSAANVCGATYSGVTANSFRIGSLPGRYASPAGDSTGFLAVSPLEGTPVTVTLMTPVNYFGFFAGSLDTFNQVQFFLNGVMVDQFSGTDINAKAFPGDPTNGNQAGAQFIDYFPTSFFNSLVISSSGVAFETDSHAFGLAVPSGVPEPASITLLGLGALALLAGRRCAGRHV